MYEARTSLILSRIQKMDIHNAENDFVLSKWHHRLTVRFARVIFREIEDLVLLLN